MTTLMLPIKITSPNFKYPEKGSDGASGYDLFAAEELEIPPYDVRAVNIGFQIEIPMGLEAQIRTRSGMALNKRIFVLNSPGTIDSDYRGDIKVILFNATKHSYKVNIGDKIAQMVICPIMNNIGFFIDNLSDTDRGDKGFGSTGY